jgi:hypothetical protein
LEKESLTEIQPVAVPEGSDLEMFWEVLVGVRFFVEFVYK